MVIFPFFFFFDIILINFATSNNEISICIYIVYIYARKHNQLKFQFFLKMPTYIDFLFNDCTMINNIIL